MNQNQSGQALIILIFAIALAFTILSGAMLSAITFGKNTRLVENSQVAYYGAESGIEYGLLKLIRNPSGCGGPIENLTIDSTNISITYSLTGAVCTLLITAKTDTILKKIQVQATISGSQVTYCCWKELP